MRLGLSSAEPSRSTQAVFSEMSEPQSPAPTSVSASVSVSVSAVTVRQQRGDDGEDAMNVTVLPDHRGAGCGGGHVTARYLLA